MVKGLSHILLGSVHPKAVGRFKKCVRNALLVNCNDDHLQSVQKFCRMANENVTLQRMDFKALSVQSIPNFKSDFIYTY